MRSQVGSSHTKVFQPRALSIPLGCPGAKEDSDFVGLALVDRELNYLDVNDVAVRIHGRPAAATVGRSVEEVIPFLAPQITPTIQRVLTTGQSVDGVTVRGGIHTDGDRVWSAAFHPVRDAAGEVAAVNCVFHEITAGIASEPALRERLAFEQFLADLSARFVNVPGERVDAEINEGLRRLVEFLDVDRCTLGRITQDGGIDVLASYAASGVPAVPPGQFGTHLKWYLSELSNGRVVRFSSLEEIPSDATVELAYSRSIGLKSHVAIPFSVGGMPLCALGIGAVRKAHQFPDESIPRLRLIGEVFANALARRDADLRVRRMQAELSHVTRVSTVGHLATSIAHEINQPLCAIVSNAQAALRLLASRKPDLDDIRGALRDIAADGKRAGDVVARSHGLLKRREPDLKGVSIHAVIRDVAALLHSESVIRQVALRMELDDSDPLVSGDVVQLQQVVLNLVVNAIEATADAPDGPRHVTVCSERDGALVRVTVSDTGVGLTREVTERMFEPFFTTKNNGLGMGLAINQTIIESHGGRLWAKPNGVRGASVGFNLPSRAAEPSPATAGAV